MPVFTFEKISPSTRPPEPVPAVPEARPRSVIAQMFDRFSERRIQRKTGRTKSGVIARNEGVLEKQARD